MTACPACGATNPRGTRYCKTCGTKLDEVRKTPAEIQEELYLAGMPAPAPAPKSRRLSLAALIFGLASLTPLTFIAGVPAVILGATALKQRRPGRVLALTGLVTGAFGTLILTFALLLPLMARQAELARVEAVKRSMRAYEAALEAYSAKNDGRLPRRGISWEPEDEDGMVTYFRAGAQFASGIPNNPYTGERYRTGKDFFYLPEALPETELAGVVDRADSECPFIGLAAPESVPGTIMILGWAPPEERGSPIEYAIVGFGRETDEPLARNARSFFVLHN